MSSDNFNMKWWMWPLAAPFFVIAASKFAWGVVTGKIKSKDLC